MKTLKHIIYLTVVTLLLSACNNDDGDGTAEQMGSLILGKWAKTLIISQTGTEVTQSTDCPDTWNFLQSTVEIKDFAGNNEAPCGEPNLDIVREYEVVDNLLKISVSNGTANDVYEIIILTSENMTLEIDGQVTKWEKL